MSALVKKYGRRQDAVITDCFVVMPEGMTDGEGNRRYCKIENAAWDTGATNTVIAPEVVQALGLTPSGKQALSTFGGIVDSNTYLIDLCFENGYRIANLPVLSGEDYSDYDVLIGMDAITKGDSASPLSTTRQFSHSVCWRRASRLNKMMTKNG